MTNEELCIKACKFAIGELIRKGSTEFTTLIPGGRHRIHWLDVMDYLEELEEQEQKLKAESEG